MDGYIKKVSVNEFEQNVTIRFDNINEGLDLYKSCMLEGFENIDCEQSFIDFILDAYRLNGEENTYIDFYYNKLSDDDKKRFYDMLTDDDKKLIDAIKDDMHSDGVYYQVDERFLELIVRLSTREILFSTIYFTKYPCTVWGNYNMKFPLFYEDDEDFDNYREIVEERCLELN